MKKYLLTILAILLISQPVFGATYAAFLRDTGVDGTTIGLNSQKQLEVLQQALLSYSGRTYYVDSVTGDSASNGESWETAMPTINEAIDRAAARISNGTDTGRPLIYVREPHSEDLTVADAVDVDIACTIWGVGFGKVKPTLNYTLKLGEFVVGADDVTLVNLRFNALTNTIGKAIDVETSTSNLQVDNLSIINCEFTANSNTAAHEFVTAIKAISTTGLTVKNCVFDMDEAQAVQALLLNYANYDTVIQNNVIRGDYSTACIVGDETLSEDLLITGNTLWNGVTSGLNTEPVWELLAGTTGLSSRNYAACNVATVNLAFVGDTMLNFENFYNESQGSGSIAWQVGVGIRTTTTVSVTTGSDV